MTLPSSHEGKKQLKITKNIEGDELPKLLRASLFTH